MRWWKRKWKGRGLERSGLGKAGACGQTDSGATLIACLTEEVQHSRRHMPCGRTEAMQLMGTMRFETELNDY